MREKSKTRQFPRVVPSKTKSHGKVVNFGVAFDGIGVYFQRFKSKGEVLRTSACARQRSWQFEPEIAEGAGEGAEIGNSRVSQCF